jgi:hypothetical protein
MRGPPPAKARASIRDWCTATFSGSSANSSSKTLAAAPGRLAANSSVPSVRNS